MNDQILLHICCAPDATTAIERLEEKFKVVGFFSNSNIQPLEEYEKRKTAVSVLKDFYGIDVIYGQYEPDRWKREMKGLENIPEGGARCRKCIYLNLLETAITSKENDISFFTTSLMTSPHKDVNWIQKAGNSIEKNIGVRYYHQEFRKRDGFLNSVKKSKLIGLYRQNYCGCEYSIYDKDGD
ncbi:MAG: epoxyqueuosine reductase QueH [Thermotogota bacterium]|nr:epoxyqueuosine reductase QueH [Thermotogota bacterium]